MQGIVQTNSVLLSKKLYTAISFNREYSFWTYMLTIASVFFCKDSAYIPKYSTESISSVFSFNQS